MRDQRNESETYHLMCMVCGALPGMTCVDSDFHELPQVHPSRRISISERNWRSLQGWEPPELLEQRRKRRKRESARAALFDPRLGPDAKAVQKAQRRSGRLASLSRPQEAEKVQRIRGEAARLPGYGEGQCA